MRVVGSFFATVMMVGFATIVLGCDDNAVAEDGGGLLAPDDPAVVFYNDFDDDPTGTYSVTNLRRDWRTPSWNNGVGAGRATIVSGEKAHDEKSLRVSYPKGAVGPGEGGAQWRLDLNGSYEELYVAYRLKFGDDFEFVRGGKLPGLVGGEANTGGNRPDGTDGWSGRIMWSGDGTLFQYVYNPDQPGRYGEGFSWEMPVLEPGTWHLVETRIVMNTRGEADGVLQSWLDGQQVLDVDDMRFRFVDDFAIDALYFSTFFGGSGPSWAPVKDEYVYFDDFVIATEPITH